LRGLQEKGMNDRSRTASNDVWPREARATSRDTIDIDVVGVPMDCGADRRGVDMGPSAIRYAGLGSGLAALGHRVHDLGNIPVPLSETASLGSSRLKYLEAMIPALQQLAERVTASVAAGHTTLTLGGDHSLAVGSITGAAKGRRLGLVWVDAHADFNDPETTPSGNVHGMPLAALCGIGDERLVTLGGRYNRRPKIDPRHIALVAARDLDPGERVLMREAGISVYSMDAIDRLGIHEVMQRAISVAQGGDGTPNTDGIYVSFDIDAVDPTFAPGVGTPCNGGLTYREAHLAVEMLAETGRVVGMDMVEVNPILDRENQTGELARELILSAFGKRIWQDALR
jgi:arginase